MLNSKLHQRFVGLAIAIISQTMGFTCFLSESDSQPKPPNPNPKQTVSGGTRGRNSQCLTDKDGRSLAPLSEDVIKKQIPLESLDGKLRNIITYSRKVGWVKADDIRKNIAEYQSPRITRIKVLTDFERLSLYGWGDLRSRGKETEFCAFVDDSYPSSSPNSPQNAR
ncbi:MAG: hypothetical protein NW214_07165 [Pseudanabaenaceae cyanobacterium bins.39]|nr:hypothetical protein [Pseudanabaenaceae cyanobacterium bins.39]